MRGQPLNQRSIAIRVVAVQIDVFKACLELRKRKVEDSAQREIVFHFRPVLGPLHVNGLSVHLSTSQPGVRVPTLVGPLPGEKYPTKVGTLYAVNQGPMSYHSQERDSHAKSSKQSRGPHVL